MKFYSGTATIGTNAHVVDISQARSLVKFIDGSFAVRRGAYRSSGPYLDLVHANVSITVSIDGHSAAGHNDATTADYDIFRKAARMLPNTCIESAEHVLKCVHANAHQTAPIDNGQGAQVSMTIPGLTWDIDQHDMDEQAFAAFPHGMAPADARIDAIRDAFEPGEGLALVYSKDPTRRRAGDWKIHAVAVLLKSTSPFDPFLLVSEVFAPDDGSDIQMTADWNVACYSNPMDFREHYKQCMPAAKYSLWKLSAA